MNPDNHALTVADVAERLGVSERTARRLFSDRTDEHGVPGPLKILPRLGSKTIRTTERSLQRWLDSIDIPAA